MSEEKINETINNLKKYVEEDNFYSGEWSVESDFDMFCYNHCLDINRVLGYLEELEKYKRKHSIVKRHYVSKDKIIEKKTKHEQKRDFYRLNMQGYSYDRECEIIEEYEELLEN